ncbi:efflux RND transporter periplasmic adaptor subunit [Bacillus sp. FJAT-29790]|uniref:efflux RND transporter periplasmic adaptor subunit n=1 Tax=Bacillus sp. FJAT-29790 TaxID=1895002 RepID=UPI001C219F57|nr:efflux RND transporter periplasmic adaptor subunit [Bacillus sp. FJAT-29790]MBU8881122.1 efflux RND transporter periplasmic adaptor subunit [Bacillus sp. FJAT-29790]
MKKITRLLGALSFIAAFSVIAGCSNDKASTEEKIEKEIPIQVAEIQYGSLSDSNRLTGTIIPESDVKVVPKAPGEIKRIMVKKGDIVKAGAVLAQLDDSAERNAVGQQQAALKQAQSGLQSAQSGKAKAEISYTQAQSSIRQAEAALANARKSRDDNLDNIEFQVKNAQIAFDSAKQNLERMQALFVEGLIAKQNLEDAEKAEKNAKNAYDQVQLNKSQASSDISFQSLEASIDQARIGASLAQSSIHEAEIGIVRAQAAVEQAQLAVQSASDRLADKVIVATASGEITAVTGEVGAMASAQNPFATIVSIDKVKISVNILPTQLSAFKQGDSVNVEVSGTDKAFTGKISYVSAISSGSGLFAIEAEVENKDHAIRPGMVASIMMDEVLVDQSLMVPSGAVIQKAGKSVIFVVADGKAVQKEVEVVHYGTDSTAITGELSEKEKVVTKGQNLLHDGDLVKIMKEE